MRMMTSTRTTPKPMSWISPLASGNEDGMSPRRPSSSNCTATAPMRAPHTVPRPPSTTISRIFTDNSKWATDGFTMVSQWV
jgi:hypothetical protein